ncbi:hypothetical protein [Nocardiopsis xinjiangensis]|uniref:hypothetical protein n=1 Tax=Nocardiopsis xinjiangensis TaxID=124285 RepID=UPI001F4C83D1|nr:hypothetical protein [Nocardiopsis xinjiangensis]
MRAIGTKDWGRALHSPRARWGAIGGAAAAVAAVAVGIGLWAASGTPDEPYPDDTYAAAPGCDLVPGEEVEDLLGEAVNDTDTTGPLHGGEHTSCAWTTHGAGEGGTLRVGLSARFTDPSADPLVTGDERTAESLGAAAPANGAKVDLPGGEARVWSGQVPGTVELAYHVDNLLVRISYAGYSDDSPSEAEEEVVGLAARLGEGL